MGVRSYVENAMRSRRSTMARFGAGPDGPFSGRADANGVPIIEFTPQITEMLRLDGFGWSLGEIYRTQPAVRICVSFLANNIAHLKLKSYRRTDETPEMLRDHPLPILLSKPNPRTSGFDLIHGTVADIAVYDTAYWLKRYVGNSRSLYRIPPAYVAPRGGNILTGPAYYVIQVAGAPRTITPDQIVDFSGYNVLDTRIGSSPLESLRAVLAEEVAASNHRAGFWKNAARRDGVIERPPVGPNGAPKWTDADRTRFRQDWQNRMSGSGNAGITPVLEDGMKWNPDSFSAKDSEFIAGREFAIDTVATVYNIPLAVLSRKGTATFASMQEFHKMLYVDTLGPWNARIEGTLWLQLLPDFGDPDLYVEFNIEEKLQGDFEQQTNAFRASVQVPTWAVNEARAKQGLKRIDDPDFDLPAKPSNYTYGNTPPPPPAAPAVPVQQVMPGMGTPPPGGANGHKELTAGDIDALERALEDLEI